MIADTSTGPRRRPNGLLRIVVALVLACVAQLVLSQFLTEVVAAGHAMFHALFALVVLLPAVAIAWRWPDGGLATRAPVVGFAALAIAQLVESLGAYGYGPDNDGRINGMVVLHDLGLGLSALGLIAAVAGLAIGVGVVGSRRTGPLRLALIGGAAVVGLGGGFVVKAMIGF